MNKKFLYTLAKEKKKTVLSMLFIKWFRGLSTIGFILFLGYMIFSGVENYSYSQIINLSFYFFISYFFLTKIYKYLLKKIINKYREEFTKMV